MSAKEFKISDDLSLPIDAVTQTFAFLAKRGAGKTYAAMKLAEQMLKNNYHLIAVDPVGVWWGLRSSADGKKEGLPVIVLGGEHGDLELSSTAGALVAQIAIEERLSLVLDLSLMRKNEQTTFMMNFSETLYRLNRDALHLMLDEADAFAPQKPMPGQARMLGAVEDIVRRGRARGVGVSLISQRSAVLNKNVLTQIETLFAFRTTSPNDRNVIKSWVEANDYEGKVPELMSTLAALEKGEAWIWSPGWLNLFKRIKILRRETYDSSSTPDADTKTIKPTAFANVDLAKIKAAIAPQPVKPKEGKVVEVVKEVEVIKEVEVFKIPAEAHELLTDIQSKLQELTTLINDGRQRLIEVDGKRGSTKMLVNPSKVEKLPKVSPAAASKPQQAKVDSDELTNPQVNILLSLYSFHQLGLTEVSKSNLAVYSGSSPNSGGYKNNLSKMRTLGFIDYPKAGSASITEKGIALVSQTQQTTILNLSELHERWCEKLSKPKAAIMKQLIEVYPEALSKDKIADNLGVSSNSGGFKNNLSNLRSLGLIDYPQIGYAAATDLMFPPGLS